MPDVMARFLTVKEAAAELGITPAAVTNAIHRGILPAERYGKEPRWLWLIDPADLKRYAKRPERRHGKPGKRG